VLAQEVAQAVEDALLVIYEKNALHCHE
jgi:hypothetical protein